MKQNRHHFFLGIFVLSGAGLVGVGVTLLGAQSLWEDTRMMETYIDESVHGLERGSPVKFRGIPVGKVTSIQSVAGFYDTSFHYALVRAEVKLRDLALPAGQTFDDTFHQRVRDGLRVTLASGGITGSTYLEAAYITDKNKFPELDIDWDPVTLYVPSTPSTLARFEKSLETVLENLSRTDLQGLVGSARDTLRRVDTALEKLDLEGLGNKAKELLARGDRVLTSADTAVTTVRADIHRVAERATDALGKAEATLARFDAVFTEGGLAESLNRFAKLIATADSTVKRIETLTTNANRAVAGVGQIVRGRSRELQLAISNLREILENLNSLTGTLERYPSLLFVGNPPKGAKR